VGPYGCRMTVSLSKCGCYRRGTRRVAWDLPGNEGAPQGLGFGPVLAIVQWLTGSGAAQHPGPRSQASVAQWQSSGLLVL